MDNKLAEGKDVHRRGHRQQQHILQADATWIGKAISTTIRPAAGRADG